MKVKITIKEGAEYPRYATAGSAGMDLYAFPETPIILNPGERKLVPTGISIALPPGYEAQVRPRSGLALKKGVTVLNSPGTIDCDYRGEIGVILYNCGSEAITISRGERIAQMVVARYEYVEWEKEKSLDNTERGTGGFGHSGV